MQKRNDRPPRHPGATWRLLMFEAHLTQLEVARRVGVTPKTLSRIVNGHTLPSEKTTVAFAKVVEGDAEQLWAEVATYRLAETMRQAGWGRR